MYTCTRSLCNPSLCCMLSCGAYACMMLPGLLLCFLQGFFCSLARSLAGIWLITISNIPIHPWSPWRIGFSNPSWPLSCFLQRSLHCVGDHWCPTKLGCETKMAEHLFQCMARLFDWLEQETRNQWTIQLWHFGIQGSVISANRP